jgi:hypothetical protein
MSWLKKRLWLLVLIPWVIFSDQVEPFKSHFWLACLGGIFVGVLALAIEVVIAMLMKTRTGS